MNFKKILLWGLGIIGIVVLIFAVLFGVMLYKGYKQISPYLSDQKVELAKVNYTDEDIKNMEKKYIKLSRPHLFAGETVTLNTPEINLIVKEKFDIKENIIINIENGKLRIDFSAPFPLTGKFLNGSAEFVPSYENSNLNITIDNIKTKEKEMTEEERKELGEFLKKYVYENEEVKKYLNKISKIYISENEVVFEIRDNVK